MSFLCVFFHLLKSRKNEFGHFAAPWRCDIIIYNSFYNLPLLLSLTNCFLLTSFILAAENEESHTRGGDVMEQSQSNGMASNHRSIGICSQPTWKWRTWRCYGELNIVCIYVWLWDLCNIQSLLSISIHQEEINFSCAFWIFFHQKISLCKAG